MKYIYALVVAAGLLLVSGYFLSVLTEPDTTRLHYTITFSDSGQVFINGEESTKGRAEDLVRDQTVDVEVINNPNSPWGICSERLGCIAN